MASIKFNNVEVFDSNGKVTTAGMPSKSIVQVVNKPFTTEYSMSCQSGTWKEVDGFSQVFTPTSSSNKVLVMISTSTSNNSVTSHTAIRITRDGNSLTTSTGVRQPALHAQQTNYSNVTNTSRTMTGWYYDSPNTTSPVTYQVWGFANAQYFYMNIVPNNTDSNTVATGISNLTLMEVVA